MPNISAEIQAFKDAYYGEDVRDAIVDLANKLNDDLDHALDTEFVTLDDTLTHSGQGADAKATGDALATKADNTNAVISKKLAVGNSASANTINSAAIGKNVSSTAQGQVVVGKYNEAAGASDKLFVVGNGIENSPSNAFTVDTSGNGIFEGTVTVKKSGVSSVVATERDLTAKQNTLTFDSAPTQNSNNPVKSGGIYTALGQKQDNLAFDATPTIGSDSPVTSNGIAAALSGKQNTLTFDNTPTSGSANPVKSGGIYTALAGKQNTLTFDNTPTQGSNNPVKSGGIYTALSTKEPIENKVSAIVTDNITTRNYPSTRAMVDFLSANYRTSTAQSEIDATKYVKPSDGIPKSDLTSAVQTLLDSAEQTANRVTSISSSATDVQYPSARAVYNAITSGASTCVEFQTSEPNIEDTTPESTSGWRLNGQQSTMFDCLSQLTDDIAGGRPCVCKCKKGSLTYIFSPSYADGVSPLLVCLTYNMGYDRVELYQLAINYLMSETFDLFIDKKILSTL